MCRITYFLSCTCNHIEAVFRVARCNLAITMDHPHCPAPRIVMESVPRPCNGVCRNQHFVREVFGLQDHLERADRAIDLAAVPEYSMLDVDARVAETIAAAEAVLENARQRNAMEMDTFEWGLLKAEDEVEGYDDDGEEEEDEDGYVLNNSRGLQDGPRNPADAVPRSFSWADVFPWSR